MTPCGNWDGPQRSLPCHMPTGHTGDHASFPGTNSPLVWPNVEAGLHAAENHANQGSAA